MSRTTTTKQTQEIEIGKFLDTKAEKEISGVFEVTAKHIEGTQLCSIELPCKYKDKELTIVVYE
jgi:hypothetical protein